MSDREPMSALIDDDGTRVDDDLVARLLRLAGTGPVDPTAGADTPPDLGELASRAGLLDVAIDAVDTPVGRLVLAATEAGVITCSYRDQDEVASRLATAVSPRVLRAPARLDPIRRELDDYFAGRLTRFTAPVDLRLTSEFGRRVLTALGGIGYGTTTTYGALASRLGRPTAARAVGHALGQNPVCVIVPCHRVLGADGRLTGYAGGVEAKQLLLNLEERSR
ncbi:MAG TPA: methylated-DNA--[protein]-cysteine S-methyltransferase [Actinomycetes bacterium]|nr:methylated-DNA--[protein]-cysteine S-methyltransferase [Actinomycetes bacterium]